MRTYSRPGVRAVTVPPEFGAEPSVVSDAVHRTARRFPGVVGSAGSKRGLELGDTRIAVYLLGALSVTEEIGVVLFLPGEDQMRGCHELGDEGAARGRTGERSGGYAEPARVVVFAFVGPELFLFARLIDEDRSGCWT